MIRKVSPYDIFARVCVAVAATSLAITACLYADSWPVGERPYKTYIVFRDLPRSELQTGGGRLAFSRDFVLSTPPSALGPVYFPSAGQESVVETSWTAIKLDCVGRYPSAHVSRAILGR